MIELVIKVGGSLLAVDGALQRIAEAIATLGDGQTVLIVPGGGPFADAVRELDREQGLSPMTAHWMAILAMDQYAHALADRLPNSIVVDSIDSAHEAIGHDDTGRAIALPVLAPFAWLRTCDPLPHSWDVTSDSIAAWVAGQVQAHTLVLVKPAPGSIAERADSYFTKALPGGVTAMVASPDTLGRLLSDMHPRRA